jgi:hypothetical protein
MPLPLSIQSPLARIRRERIFPAPARILVRQGQVVAPGDGIAQAIREPRHFTLDLAYSLGLPAGQIEPYVQFSVGTVVAEGDVLAGPVGVARRVVRAPFAGKIVRIQNGELILQISTPPDELVAGLPGEVVELVESRGAVIELEAALIQGVWGNGRSAYAACLCLAGSPDEQLILDAADSRLKGAILAGGPCQLPDTLRIARQAGAAGLLVSSLAPELFEAARQAPYPIVIVEGFGCYPYDPSVHALLVELSGRAMALDASPWDRTSAQRPEAILPRVVSPEADQEPLRAPAARSELGLIQPGQRVRITAWPYLGLRGSLVDLPGLVEFSHGIRGVGARVRLEDGKEILLPLTNLEFLA